MRIIFSCFLLLLMAVSPVRAQYSYPGSASIRLGFVQIADGGAPIQRWTTTIAVANPDPDTAATVTLTFYDNSGQLLPLDFGQGAVSTLVLNVPAGGSRIVTSTGTSSTTTFVTGWGRGISNVPVYGTVIYRATSNGVPVWDVAAAGTGPTYFYAAQAKYTLGVALANPNTADTVHLRLSTKDQNGTAGNNYDVTLPPNCHD